MIEELFTKPPRRLIILGAGASADSGLPTYRGPDGLYNTTTCIPTVKDLESEERRLALFRTSQVIYSAAHTHVPGPTYLTLRAYATGACIVTQNVDGYADEAFGDVTSRVIEFHGTMKFCKCMDCEKTIPTPHALF